MLYTKKVSLATAKYYSLRIISYIFYTILWSILYEFFWKRSQFREKSGNSKTIPEDNTVKHVPLEIQYIQRGYKSLKTKRHKWNEPLRTPKIKEKWTPRITITRELKTSVSIVNGMTDISDYVFSTFPNSHRRFTSVAPDNLSDTISLEMCQGPVVQPPMTYIWKSRERVSPSCWI